MTGRGVRPDPPPMWLIAVVDALETGNWREVLRIYAQVAAEAEAEAAVLLTIAYAIALGMKWHEVGEPKEAWWQHGAAARMLPWSMSPWRHQQAVPRAVLTLPPGPDSGMPMLTWQVGRVVVREQADLDELRRRMATPRLALRDALIYAAAEMRRRIDDDPWTRTEPAAVAPSAPVAFCRWATRLRRFGTPTTADVDPAVLRRANGLCGLHADTMRYLAAAEPPVAGVPLRRGWERARAHAIQWLDDIQ